MLAFLSLVLYGGTMFALFLFAILVWLPIAALFLFAVWFVGRIADGIYRLLDRF